MMSVPFFVIAYCRCLASRSDTLAVISPLSVNCRRILLTAAAELSLLWAKRLGMKWVC